MHIRIRFRIQFDADPDADPGYQNDADPDPDADPHPQHWNNIFFVYFQDHEKTPYPKYAEYEVVPGEKVGQTVEK